MTPPTQTAELSEIARLRTRIQELERFQRIVEQMPMGVAVMDAQTKEPGDFRLSYANDRASTESQLDVGAMLGKTLRDVAPHDFQDGALPKYELTLRRVLATGNAEIVELDRGPRGSFDVHYIRLDAHGIAAIYQNVTSRKQAEASVRHADQALRALEVSVRDAREKKSEMERFRNYLDSAPDAIVIVDSRGQMVLANARTEEVFGYEPQELQNQSIELLLPESTRDKHPEHRAAYFANAHARVMGPGLELYGRRKDGSSFPVEINLAPLETEEGTLVASAIRDISARKEAERRLRESEERFTLLVGTVKDYAIFMLDPSGRVASWNAGAERIKGYSADEIIGQHFSRFYPAEDVAKRKPQRELEIAIADGRCEDEGWRLRKDGSRFLASVVITAVLDRAGKVLGFAKITRDVTERYMADIALKFANKELEAFSYSVAHDLRAPLRGMNGFAQILLGRYQDKLDADGKDWLQEILSNARKMGKLIDGLLSLSRVTRSDLKPERVDLSVMARAVGAEIAKHDPERVVEFSVSDGLMGEVDPRLARAIFENLLGNAWKFTQHVANPRVQVGLIRDDNESAFFVRDNGAGFDMQFADKLFAPFQRLHTVGEFPGTGIGLATVQRIVHRHGGKIWAEGQVDGGATFFFTLPGRLNDGRLP